MQMLDDDAPEGSPKNEIVCGWIRSTGAEPLRRGKFAVNFLRWKREIRSPISKGSENSPTN
jgi:hypothetical protein